MSVCIVIPAYQAARHIQQVLRRISAVKLSGLTRVIVVDDGSQDETSELVRSFSELGCPLECIVRPQNGGYGAAMKTGLAAARDTHGTAPDDVVACVHADGQYAPEVLPELIRALQERRLDLVQGSRILGGRALAGGMPLYKYVANAGLNILENWTLRLSLTDYHSGYLVYGARALRQIPFAELSDSFDFDLEVIASAAARNLNVAEAPIPTHYGDEVSHLDPIGYGMRVLRVLWRYKHGVYGPV